MRSVVGTGIRHDVPNQHCETGRKAAEPAPGLSWVPSSVGSGSNAKSEDVDLGFQAESTASRYPIISQIASQLLTLQGAVAHTDMPLDSGPTQLLPYSQHFDNGYVAYRHPEFTEIFHEKMVQLPLRKGDGLFFNPALFHAAGENRTTDFHRSANLLQISASWGKAMESVDRARIVRLVWPHLPHMAEELGEKRVAALFKMIAEGYSFPTNLDKDPPPAGGVRFAFDRVLQ